MSGKRQFSQCTVTLDRCVLLGGGLAGLKRERTCCDRSARCRRRHARPNDDAIERRINERASFVARAPGGATKPVSTFAMPLSCPMQDTQSVIAKPGSPVDSGAGQGRNPRCARRTHMVDTPVPARTDPVVKFGSERPEDKPLRRNGAARCWADAAVGTQIPAVVLHARKPMCSNSLMCGKPGEFSVGARHGGVLADRARKCWIRRNRAKIRRHRAAAERIRTREHGSRPGST